MAVKIKFDSNHNVIPPTFVLATRSGKKMNAPIPALGITIADHFNDKFELSFSVSKYDNNVKYPLWDKLQDFKLCWCKEWDVWFEMYVEKTDDNALSKHISLVSLGEAELSQINLYGIEINTEDDIARDDYEPSVLYNPDKPEASILDRILDKAPHYSIDYVDASIASIQRTFSFDGTTIYDALQEIAEEIDCIVVINSGSNNDGSIQRSISVFDLESYCYECGNRSHYSGVCPKCGSTNVTRGYGEDTTIFVSTENLADNITLSTDYESVKNCFRLEAGDDLMTATVIDCNPNGSQYLWYITDSMKEDMSDELVAKLNDYDELFAYYQNEYPTTIPPNLVTAYNDIVDKYREYHEELVTISSPIVGYSTLMNVYYDTIDLQLLLESTLMPTRTIDQTDAETQAALLTVANMSPVSVTDLSLVSFASASNAVLSMAKTLIDPRFKVKVLNSSYNSTTHVWTGNFTVENYSDEEDVATSQIIDVVLNEDYENFLEQQIDRTLKNVESEISSQGPSDIVALFKLSLEDFTSEIKKYCLASLDLFEDSCQKCLEVLQAQGVADNITWADKNPNLYETLYVPYYNKLLAIQAELQVREEEIAVIKGVYDEDNDVAIPGVQTYIIESKETIQEATNMRNYLGEELWLEFIAYRREDTFSNDNYISDGLNNAEQFARALEFINLANEEIYKSATLQHSLSASLQNLLVIKEFEPIVDYFAVGNWIRVKIDGEVFRLRLISYEIDFDNLSNLSVEFSDVKKFVDGMSDSESIMNQAQSMASSYGSVSRQASQGKKSNAILDNWVQKGLDLTKLKIVDDVDNQTISWDEHGFLCKEYVPFTNSYDDRQLKIINNGLYITDNNWLSIKTAIGRFYYIDPSSGEITEAYGVNGETIVGKLLLGEQLGIYNPSGSLTFDSDGLVVKSSNNIVTINPNSSSIFTIQKITAGENNAEVLTNILSLDSSGNLVIAGSGTFNGSGTFSGTITASAGYIGGTSKTNGWQITTGKIETQYTINGATRYMGMGISGTAWAFYAAAATTGGSDGVFRVSHNGTLYATGAQISGNITATSGTIGGCSISDGVLQIGNANITGTLTGKTISSSSISGTSISGGTISGTSISGGTISGATITSTSGNNSLIISGANIDFNTTSNVINYYGIDFNVSSSTKCGIYFSGSLQGNNTYRYDIDLVTMGNGSMVNVQAYEMDLFYPIGSRVSYNVGNNNQDIALSTHGNAGVYSDTHSKWLIYINSSGTVTANTSDIRYKNVLGKLPDEEAIEILENVDIINFTYKKDQKGVVQNGISAQQLRDILINKNIGYRPYLSIAEKDGDETFEDITVDEDKVVYSVDYGRMMPLVWKGWQIHNEQIKALCAENETLKTRIQELERKLA